MERSDDSPVGSGMLQASHIRQTCASGRCWRGARLVVLECHVLAPGTSILRADVAQLVEQLIRNQQVTRSSRVVGSITSSKNPNFPGASKLLRRFDSHCDSQSLFGGFGCPEQRVHLVGCVPLQHWCNVRIQVHRDPDS
jgi:hypothetical protein